MARQQQQQRNLNLKNVELRTDDGVLFDPVRLVVRDGHAYATSPRGDRVWFAQLDSWDRQASNQVTLHLADGPDVHARSYCRPCTARH